MSIHRVIFFILLTLWPLSVSAAQPCAQPEASTDKIAAMYRTIVFRANPRTDPTTTFNVYEYDVPGAKEHFCIQIFQIDPLIGENEKHLTDQNAAHVFYRNDELAFIIPLYGEHGLMSAAYSEEDKHLYFTYSWNPGVHTSRVARMRMTEDGKIETEETGDFVNDDVFVKRTEDGSVEIETGFYASFNTWEKIKTLADVPFTKKTDFTETR